LDSVNIIAYVGDTVKIACTTSGSPRPHRKWLVNDENIYELDCDFKESKNEL
jgi:DNA-binding LytR/AlgR family response regulator